MQNMFNQTLEAMKEALKGTREKAYSLEARIVILRDLHWGEEEALRRFLLLCAEAGNIQMDVQVLQDALGYCNTIASLEINASRAWDYRARAAFLEDGVIQEEEEARGRLGAVMTSLQ